MQSPSATAHRGCVRWQGLLLAVLLLTIWNLPTTAQITVKAVPPNAVVGEDVLFLVSGLNQNLYSYIWCKGGGIRRKDIILSYLVDRAEITPGHRYDGREKLYPNGSLLLQNVTQEDTGCYTIEALQRNMRIDTGTTLLCVHPLVSKPPIRVRRGRRDPSDRT
ncbi:carcinoembryonic antigen-related cell adhesion molecule 3-like [Diceros bicornis minor]|uniref:carcinoembryonic antigen-related cell adhesion molecule 3-like n=1 Tax=Diceros bicornis minor TaxID=77932 RepID=UPI0026EDA573|nr:carcinoembryonic antigen-related cell adhesion molecule 3-like [Diceros bicornis minor]